MLMMAYLIIQRSESGELDRDDWVTLLPDEVPEWLKRPEILRSIQGGVMVMDDSTEDKNWYRGFRPPPDLEVFRNWVNTYLAEHSDVLLSDDVSMGIKKWRTLVLSMLDQLWGLKVMSVISGITEGPDKLNRPRFSRHQVALQ